MSDLSGPVCPGCGENGRFCGCVECVECYEMSAEIVMSCPACDHPTLCGECYRERWPEGEDGPYCSGCRHYIDKEMDS